MICELCKRPIEPGSDKFVCERCLVRLPLDPYLAAIYGARIARRECQLENDLVIDKLEEELDDDNHRKN